MRRSTKIMTTVALTFGVIGGAIAYGKAKFNEPGARAEYMMSYISEELELDATQYESLTALKEQVLMTKGQMKNEMTPAREQFKALISAEQFDQAKALEILSNKTSTLNANAPDVMVALGNFLDGLNAEQKAEILEFMDHKRKGSFGRRGFGDHH